MKDTRDTSGNLDFGVTNQFDHHGHKNILQRCVLPGLSFMGLISFSARVKTHLQALFDQETVTENLYNSPAINSLFTKVLILMK